jgi:hypothetical protein
MCLPSMWLPSMWLPGRIWADTQVNPYNQVSSYDKSDWNMRHS